MAEQAKMNSTFKIEVELHFRPSNEDWNFLPESLFRPLEPLKIMSRWKMTFPSFPFGIRPNNNAKGRIIPLPETKSQRTWKLITWKLEDDRFPFGIQPIFRGVGLLLLVSAEAINFSPYIHRRPQFSRSWWLTKRMLGRAQWETAVGFSFIRTVAPTFLKTWCVCSLRCMLKPLDGCFT